jgi:hypothetical protein
MSTSTTNRENEMATIYDGNMIAKGTKLPSGEWGWSDFGWHTSLPAILVQFAPEAELAKARKNPAFAEWIGGSVGNDGARQAAEAAANSAASDAKMLELYGSSGVMNHGGNVRVGLCEDGE